MAIGDFYKHIFQQLTKFFSFLKNPQSVAELVDKIFQIVSSDQKNKRLFKSLIKGKELYKFIKDTIENSKNILLIVDGEKDELPEIMQEKERRQEDIEAKLKELIDSSEAVPSLL